MILMVKEGERQGRSRKEMMRTLEPRVTEMILSMGRMGNPATERLDVTESVGEISQQQGDWLEKYEIVC